MATLGERSYISTFAGLKSTAITAGSFLVIGFTLNEVLKRLRRYPDEDRRRARGEKVRDRGVEAYAMGYLYRARSFVPHLPTPDFGSRPLAWIYTTSYKLPEKYYETHCGVDATTYLRFLRGTFYWTLLLTCTIFPLLLSIHFVESDTSVSTASITRASLTSLVLAPNGTRLLWIHVTCIWLISFSWYVTLAWIGYGTVRMRRNNLRRLLRRDAESPQKADSKRFVAAERPPVDPNDERPVGWRWRTILMRNIPPALRSESAIHEYFETCLRPSSSGSMSEVEKDKQEAAKVALERFDALHSSSSGKPLICNIILVRKQSELNELFLKWRNVQHELESAHTELAQNVMKFVAAKVDEQKRREEGKPAKKPLWSRVFHKRDGDKVIDVDLERIARAGDDKIVDLLRRFLPDPNKPLPEETEPGPLWTALYSLHSSDPTLLDRFQPLIKLKHFRGQKIPSLDYYLAKFNLLTRLIEDMRADPEKFEVASSAFVTFERASDARRARTEMKSRASGKRWGHQVFECKIKGAPEKRDLDWNRLVHVSLSGDILRSFLLQSAIWAITVIWVIPVSFVVGLLSLTTISDYIPKLADFLNGNTITQSLFQSLLPTSIVALLGMLVPTLIGIITRKGQALITTTKVHSAVQARYWKWSMTNIILVFCIGLTAFDAFLNAFKSPGSVLTVIASAFPKGATFFVSWTLLVVGVHHGIEICLLGIPWINHASIRKYKAPRKREAENEPRFFNYAYWLPNHLIVFAVTAIFACFNPLVIAFNMFYQLFELAVFKNQISHVYWRRWYENGGRFIYRRLFRYSLDVFLVAQAILMAFMFVNKKVVFGGVIIPLLPITVFVKLIGTRWFDALLDELDEAEIDIVCDEGPEVVEELSVPLTEMDHDMHRLNMGEALGVIKTFATTTLPALALHPKEKLPIIPSPAKKATHFRSRAGSRGTLANRSRANSHVRHEHSRASMDDNRPLTQVRSQESSTADSYEAALAAAAKTTPTPIRTSGGLDLKSSTNGQHADEKADAEHSVQITVHPAIIRDDRPVTNVRYDNPALVATLEKGLWLPANPLIPVDLGDTIDYHGRALVSSEGGDGLIGSWEDEHQASENADVGEGEGEGAPTDDRASNNGPKLSILERQTSRISSSTKERPVLSGNERIRVASDVAVRIEAEGGLAPVETLTNGQRHSSTGTNGSIMSGIMPSMRRRGTGSSGGSQAVIVVSSAQGDDKSIRSGVAGVQRQFDPPRPSPPRIPSFSSHQSSTHDRVLPSSATDVFSASPPETPAAHNSLSPTRRRPSELSQSSLRARSTSRERSSSIGLRSPRHPTTRGGRSASVALSAAAMSIAEEDESTTVVVSQAVALRGELLEEERLEHEERMQKELKRRAKEAEDRKAGWFARMLLKHGVEGDPKET